jgi:hypothetical protein
MQCVFIHMKTNHVHQRQALCATAGQFCASDQSNERGQMPDGAGKFSRQIPAYAGLTSGQIPGQSELTRALYTHACIRP